MSARTSGIHKAYGRTIWDPVIYTRIYMCTPDVLLSKLMRLRVTSSATEEFTENPVEPKDEESVFFTVDGMEDVGRVEMLRIGENCLTPVYLEDNERTPLHILDKQHLDYFGYPRVYYHSVLVTNPIQIPRYATERNCSIPLVILNKPQAIDESFRLQRRGCAERTLIKKLQKLNECGRRITGSFDEDEDTDDEETIEQYISYLRNLKVRHAGHKVNSYRYQLAALDKRHEKRRLLRMKENERVCEDSKFMPPPAIPKIATTSFLRSFTPFVEKPPLNVTKEEEDRWRNREEYITELRKRKPTTSHDYELAKRAKAKLKQEIREKTDAGTMKDPVAEWYERQTQSSDVVSQGIDLSNTGWDSDDEDEFIIVNDI